MGRIKLPTSSKLPLAVAACVGAGLLASLASVAKIGLLPPSIEARSLAVAGAGARIVVDNPRSLVGDRLATDGDYQSLQRRAVLMGSLMTTPPVRAHIARLAGIDPDDFVGRTRVTANVQAVLIEPDSEQRATLLAEANAPFRLEVHPDPVLPALSVYAQAPTVVQAERIANAAAPGLRAYLRALAIRSGTDPKDQVVLEQPGRARGAIINGGAKMEIFGLTFVFVLALAAFARLLVTKLRRQRSGGGAEPPPGETRPAPLPPAPAATTSPRWRAPPVAERAHARGIALTPAVAVAAGSVLAAPGALTLPASRGDAATPRRAALRAGDWPRTTRVLPWMLAAMMAVVWLVPFNVIQLSYSLPVDLKFDRLVLPFIVVTWALSLAAGGPGAPRVRVTWIHVALGGVAIAALFSLVHEARQLNQLLELDTSIKKLTLLASYISLFVVVASSIRRREVPAFLKYTLGLAVICALGTIVEYRFAYNVFYKLSAAVLPGIFTVGVPESGAVDQIGRAIVVGPGEVSLEAVAMLAMGLPIAVSGLIASKVTRTRVLYGLATALILAAAASTERKSALLAPASVFVTLAYFRRRELIRLAPAGLVIAVVMLLLTPGAAQSVVGQLSGSSLNSVSTVSDRSSDYDAVRPDVWSHLAFGRGYGSYDHTSYRILDMELLRQLVEVGVFGLAAFVVLIGTIVAVARRPIRERRRHEAAVGLSAAAAAVALLTVSALFDAMAFPHCPYIALWMAGLLAVVVSHGREDEEVDGWSS